MSRLLGTYICGHELGPVTHDNSGLIMFTVNRVSEDWLGQRGYLVDLRLSVLTQPPERIPAILFFVREIRRSHA